MAPKNKGKGKAKASSEGGDAGGKSKGLKAANSINVRHILTDKNMGDADTRFLNFSACRQCEKHSKKEEALAKLKSGAKFDDVAREFSEDKARQGGSLGWKIRGSLDAAFEKAAYDLEPSTTANPKYTEVKTGFGYHIIMVEGRK
ncbi:Peptidyl-prolyl cis-trans isomerase pin4 [Emydomyces testavorans]|uniref:Peptidyl-prolyl cis-trans isomerase n=1 Tax=Emydomyces testavorans TaxID=2070801 RepID=A0AAF0DBA4_9EURO|nr:Peptidyl-prolyl cis-trans isomerase pin4 [Emydomyces testavorans]